MARFSSLPHAVQVHIFTLLPMDVRLRCTEVCRSWRLALQDTAAWKHLVVPDCQYSGVNPYRLLRAALARTGGLLETLDVSHLEAYEGFLEHTLFKDDTLLAPKQTRLRELRVGPVNFFDLIDVTAITGGGQQLQQLSAALRWSEWYSVTDGRICHDMRWFHGALRVRTLGLDQQLEGLDDDELKALFTRIRRVVGELSNPEFSALYVDFDVLDDDILGFVTDLAAAHEPPLLLLGLEQYEDWPELSFDIAVRLLRLNALPHFDSRFWKEHLEREDRNDGSEDAAVWSVICAAVRDCTSLRTVVLDPRLARVSATDARQFTAALIGHPSIACIVPDDEDLEEPEDIDCGYSVDYGRGLAEIVAANAPALRRLYVCHVALEEDGLMLLFRALPRNTHLKELAFGNSASSTGLYCEHYDQAERPPLWRLDLVENWLVPSVQQNRSLRELKIDPGFYPGGLFFNEFEEEEQAVISALQAAEALVRERSDPKVLAAARDWQRAYRRWTSQP